MLANAHFSLKFYALALWALTGLFFLRVAGQAIQYSFPQDYLPSFAAFQGSSLPYWLLLSLQLFMLGTMAHVTRRIQCGKQIPHRRLGKLLKWLGAIYMVSSLGRIVIGLSVSGAPAWFSTWIPAFFHIVLAGFVLMLAQYHCQAGEQHS